MTNEIKENAKNLINNYIIDTVNYIGEAEKIERGEIDDINEEILKKNVNENPIYKKMLERKNFLKLDDNELNEYSFLLSDEHKYNSFFNFMKAFKTSIKIKENLKKSKNNNMNVKTIDEINNKIMLLRIFEQDNNIKPFDINFLDSKDIKINMSDDNIKHLKDIFRMTKTKPNNNNDLKKMYIGMLKNIFGSLNIINSKYKTDTQNKNKKIITHLFNTELIEQLFKVVFKMKIDNLDDNLLKSINIKKPLKEYKENNSYDDFLNQFIKTIFKVV